MASVNKCTFIGNLTRDPEVKYMTSGDAVANVSIACNESWKDKSGEKQESVEFVNLVFYRKLAEIVGEYIKKGAPIYVEGKMKTRSWEDKESGQKRYATEIIVNEMQMLGGKRDNEQQDGSDPAPQRTAPAAKPAAKGAFDNFDDDIPFRDTYAKSNGLWRAV